MKFSFGVTLIFCLAFIATLNAVTAENLDNLPSELHTDDIESNEPLSVRDGRIIKKLKRYKKKLLRFKIKKIILPLSVLLKGRSNDELVPIIHLDETTIGALPILETTTDRELLTGHHHAVDEGNNNNTENQFQGIKVVDLPTSRTDRISLAELFTHLSPLTVYTVPQTEQNAHKV